MDEHRVRTLYRVAAALLALLALTVGLSYLDLGSAGFAIALAVAAVKAMLVGWFFMELEEGVPAVWFMAGAALVWLGLLVSGTLADLFTRL
ncbi:MAG TPA: cytochrome C oxidase subunit IV family protein [Elusimicrobiota bacterium]|nr:cytochrome C oxidase subunit IV family protein [Elusimicrobiota bacterium]